MEFSNNVKNYHGDLAWTLLGFAFFFSPLRCYGLFTIGTFTGSLFKLFMLVAMVVVSAKLMTRSYYLYKNKTTLIIVLILLADIITFLYSNQSNYGLFPTYFIEHVILLFIIIIIDNHHGSTDFLVKAYIYSAIIPGALGLYQWITVMRTGRVPVLPFAQFLVTAGKDDIFLYGNYRVVGTLQDPSYYGLYMATVFILCLGLIVGKNYGIHQKKTELVANISICILSGICVFVSGSVTSMVAILTGVLYFFFAAKLKIGGFVKYVIFGIVLIGLSFVFLKYVFDYDPFTVLIEKLSIQSKSSSVGAAYGRGEFFSAAIDDFWKSPIFGVGFGNMTNSSGHNSFLTILALQGIIGLMLHVCLLFVIPFYYVKRMVIQCNGLQMKHTVRLASLFGMLCLCMGYDCLYKMDPTIVVLALTLGFDSENGV